MPKNNYENNNRRRFIKLGLTSMAFAPIATLLLSRSAVARGSRAVSGDSADVPKLPENDRQAMALAYREDSALVDRTKYKVADGAVCRNCQLYSGADEDQWGPCAIFSYRVHPILNKNYVVSAKGWCRSWSPRTS